jgi:hypothetical protein
LVDRPFQEKSAAVRQGAEKYRTELRIAATPVDCGSARARDPRFGAGQVIRKLPIPPLTAAMMRGVRCNAGIFHGNLGGWKASPTALRIAASEKIPESDQAFAR